MASPTVVPLSPPRGPDSDAVAEALRQGGFLHEVIYLPPGAPLEAVVPVALPAPRGPAELPLWMRDLGQSEAIVALVAFAVAALVFLAWRKGAFHVLRPGRFEGGPAGETPGFMEGVEAGGGPDAWLSGDPREGMRRLLARALRVAANENGIVLRRAFTSRDILRRVPAGWPGRERLGALVSAAEPVVFGGRTLDRETLARHLEDARPLLERTVS